MKKVYCFFIVWALCVFLVGCGNKSDSVFVNIEQFKCQDSIETVFNVIGETDMEVNKYIGECYRYKNLNLFGYNGEALFRVRDNKKTIQSFECNFKLTKKEFEDVLFQLENKYGRYEKNENQGQTAYVWIISKDEADQFGYNRVSFTDYGDKKATIDFSDEWSARTDESYYESLKEAESIDDAENTTVVLKEEYNIGDSDIMTVAITENENKESLYISAEVANEYKASLVFIYLYSILSDSILEKTDYGILITSDSGMVSLIGGKPMGTNKDGSAVLTIPDWVIQDTESCTLSDTEQSEIINTVRECISDFSGNLGE